jgi:hypothetical protein
MSDYWKGQERMSLSDFWGILPGSAKGYTALLDNHKQQRGKLFTHVDILMVSTKPVTLCDNLVINRMCSTFSMAWHVKLFHVVNPDDSTR